MRPHFLNNQSIGAPVAHTYNPSFWGGRDQEDYSLKPAPCKEFVWHYLEKNPSPAKAGGVAQGAGPEFKLQYYEKKKRSNGFD
jgi:hypothetical protein